MNLPQTVTVPGTRSCLRGVCLHLSSFFLPLYQYSAVCTHAESDISLYEDFSNYFGDVDSGSLENKRQTKLWLKFVLQYLYLTHKCFLTEF